MSPTHRHFQNRSCTRSARSPIAGQPSQVNFHLTPPKLNANSPTSELIQNVPPKNASTLVLLSWPDVTSCYFDLRPSNLAGNSTNSNFIRVLSQARPTPIIVGLNQNSSTIPVEPTNTVTITAVPSSDGMSSGTKIGIGFGVALGVVLIFAAGLAAFLLRRRRKVKNQAAIQLLNVDDDSWKSEFGNEPQRQFVLMQPIPMEMQAKSHLVRCIRRMSCSQIPRSSWTTSAP